MNDNLFLKRASADHKDFQLLVTALDKDLALRNGDKNDSFVPFNKTTSLQQVVIAYYDEVPVGCGSLKPYDTHTMEIKRMFVVPFQRGKGIASAILHELEQWATELQYEECILETGQQMPEAIALYQKTGYSIIPNYGPYVNIESSICFKKAI